ncbi:laccase, multicopper oxidase, benzenediol:oxygen oxidorectuctase [Marasmius tenuissimus]|uniref:Laccase, multicopper oxidase, benzenediol:oxygen oxidorectuctase n=1 Tax=Marasmius tenuissimus TaxID=585030 RepID=A0ABR3A9N7_9AGAR|nr:laccase, multicopper oxidase, benzenediol:oxygen oxidorectuctase [Marasmius tenuissimus]
MLYQLLGGLLAVSSAQAVVRNFDLIINNTIIAPDGFERHAITPNGTFPGPTFFVQKGEDVDIAMKNDLTDPTMRRSTSIHWHGFFQPRTSYADGPAFVNQCPIPPGNTFHYAFPTAGQTGNYWYHSHLSTQYCDGLRGAFIVYDPDDPLKDLYDVDDESTVITLADWYHDVAPDAQDKFFKSGSVPIPDSGLINGRGRYIGGPEVPYAVIQVEAGKRYRFRLIQISCRPFMTFSIDNHNITVMELDGVEHDPVTAQNIDIYVAQRASVIVNANQPVDNYWIRAPPTGGAPASAGGNPNFDPALTRAILRYVGAPDEEPTTTNPGGPKLNDGDMHPIAQEGPGKLGDQPADIAFNLMISQPNPPFFDINGISYLSPTVPVLLQIMSGAGQPQDFLPSEQILLITPNATIDVSIPGTGAHPFHLHGHNFDVIRQTNATEFNFKNPSRHDVFPINGGNTTFRFKADNPGAWFLHCHIDWHLEAGLAVVFAESPALNREDGPFQQITPQDWEQLCPEYDALPPEEQ